MNPPLESTVSSHFPSLRLSPPNSSPVAIHVDPRQDDPWEPHWNFPCRVTVMGLPLLQPTSTWARPGKNRPPVRTPQLLGRERGRGVHRTPSWTCQSVETHVSCHSVTIPTRGDHPRDPTGSPAPIPRLSRTGRSQRNKQTS